MEVCALMLAYSEREHASSYMYVQKVCLCIKTIVLQDNSSVLTCIKIISTVDYMIAAGSQHGIVTVFQVPKIIPDESALSSQNKQVCATIYD
jgi:hypothetical protein